MAGELLPSPQYTVMAVTVPFRGNCTKVEAEVVVIVIVIGRREGMSPVIVHL
ncbi:unannotated protein [freshwater metagenome]|uniref:Unannotated protein n=1 Tax=freshwater metagenome TaxID=449393 RepID=A0A6J7LEG1_9ZZZZ